MNPTTQLRRRYIHLAQQHGSSAQTFRGAARFLRNHPEALRPASAFSTSTSCVPVKHVMRSKWHVQPLPDERLRQAASEIARERYPRRKNWDWPEPTADPHCVTGHVATIDHGQYSSRCKWYHLTYEPRYHSAVRIAISSGAVAEVWQEGRMVRRIMAPAGLRFGADDEGIFVVSRDGTEYHPEPTDWHDRAFAALVRNELSCLRAARRHKIRQQRDAERLARTTLVTLHDARRVGLCVQGITAYLSRLHGLRREDVVAPFAAVKAASLDQSDGRVRRAVAAAIQRETLVTI